MNPTTSSAQPARQPAIASSARSNTPAASTTLSLEGTWARPPEQASASSAAAAAAQPRGINPAEIDAIKNIASAMKGLRVGVLDINISRTDMALSGFLSTKITTVAEMLSIMKEDINNTTVAQPHAKASTSSHVDSTVQTPQAAAISKANKCFQLCEIKMKVIQIGLMEISNSWLHAKQQLANSTQNQAQSFESIIQAKHIYSATSDSILREFQLLSNRYHEVSKSYNSESLALRKATR